jgi:hypothetical protein
MRPGGNLANQEQEKVVLVKILMVKLDRCLSFSIPDMVAVAGCRPCSVSTTKFSEASKKTSVREGGRRFQNLSELNASAPVRLRDVRLRGIHLSESVGTF